MSADLIGIHPKAKATLKSFSIFTSTISLHERDEKLKRALEKLSCCRVDEMETKEKVLKFFNLSRIRQFYFPNKEDAKVLNVKESFIKNLSSDPPLCVDDDKKNNKKEKQ